MIFTNRISIFFIFSMVMLLSAPVWAQETTITNNQLQDAYEDMPEDPAAKELAMPTTITTKSTTVGDETNDLWREVAGTTILNKLGFTSPGQASRIVFGNAVPGISTYGLNTRSEHLEVEGLQIGQRAHVASLYAPQLGEAVGTLGYGGAYSDYGLFIGQYSAGRASVLTAANNKLSRALGGLFFGGSVAGTALSLDSTGRYQIGGLYAELQGTINNNPANSIMAAIIGVDRSNGSSTTYAGYFQGERNYMSGKLGIGTKTPEHRLDVNGDIMVRGKDIYSVGHLRLNPTNGGYVEVKPNGATHGLVIREYNSSDFGNIKVGDYGLSLGYNIIGSHMLITSSGNIGIGTQTPTARLHAAGVIKTSNGTNEDKFIEMYHGGINAYMNVAGGGNFYIRHNEAIRMFITEEGNIGMGTTTPDNKLDVRGTIRSEEVKVELGWSDYVFYDDYQLPTLREEAAHIQKKGHLLGFESEADMGGEIQLGDVSKRQQAKIEEMMLHLIEMNTRLEKLENENAALRQQLEK